MRFAWGNYQPYLPANTESFLLLVEITPSGAFQQLDNSSDKFFA
jgi:hypothetical protein